MTNDQNTNPERSIMHQIRTCGLALILLVAPAACDTNVSNPGPVQDNFLDDRNASLQTGAAVHLVKPVDPKQLVATLDSLLAEVGVEGN